MAFYQSLQVRAQNSAGAGMACSLYFFSFIALLFVFQPQTVQTLFTSFWDVLYIFSHCFTLFLSTIDHRRYFLHAFGTF